MPAAPIDSRSGAEARIVEPTVKPIVEPTAEPLDARHVTRDVKVENVAVEKQEEKAVAASAHVVAPVATDAPVPQAVQIAPEAAAISAASARTEAIVETVNHIVEAVVGQILVTPGITHGECEVKIMLKPTVLDGSEITMSSKDGTLTVCVTPATPEASATAVAALPRLETALAEHAPAFRQVSVSLAMKKGNRNETV